MGLTSLCILFINVKKPLKPTIKVLTKIKQQFKTSEKYYFLNLRFFYLTRRSLSNWNKILYITFFLVVYKLEIEII